MIKGPCLNSFIANTCVFSTPYLGEGEYNIWTTNYKIVIHWWVLGGATLADPPGVTAFRFVIIYYCHDSIKNFNLMGMMERRVS